MAAVDREQIGEWLSAYIDGELNDEQNDVIERLLREDAKMRRLLEELRATVTLVSSLPRHPAPPGICDDISRHLERDELLGPAEEVATPTRGRRRVPFGQLATAAMFALIVFGCAWWYMNLSSPSAPRDERLAEASKPGADEPTKELYPSNKARRHSAVRRPLSKKGSPASPSDSRVGRGDAVASRATIEQKLAVNVPQEELLKHPFGNETNTFKIILPSNATRDLAVYRLTAHLAANGFADIEHRTGEKGDRLGEGSFYLKGQAGVNFAADSERQILVRARPSEVPALVNTLAGSDARRDSAVLQVGPVVARGWEQTQTLTNQIAGLYAEERREALASTPEKAPERGEPEQLRKLMDALGIPGFDRLAGAVGPDSNDFLPEKELLPDKDKTTREVNGTGLPGPEFERDEEAEEEAESKSAAAVPSTGVRRARTAAQQPRRGGASKLDEAKPGREKPPSEETAGPTRSAETNGAAEDEGKDDPVVEPKAHTAIVERRLEEIARAAREQAEEKPPLDSVKSVADEKATPSRPSDEVTVRASSPERFVTLVIQVAGPPRVSPPRPPARTLPAAKQPKAKAKSKAGGTKPDSPNAADR